jgi:hypothetical protein
MSPRMNFSRIAAEDDRFCLVRKTTLNVAALNLGISDLKAPASSFEDLRASMAPFGGGRGTRDICPRGRSYTLNYVPYSATGATTTLN